LSLVLILSAGEEVKILDAGINDPASPIELVDELSHSESNSLYITQKENNNISKQIN
jgi:hypothetical protein